MEPPRDAVKEGASAAKRRPGRGLLSRYSEGWELGGIIVLVVLSAALLAVPRAAPPVAFPVPLVDVAEARIARERLSALADQAERTGLPFETRAVGDAVRRVGSMLSAGAGDSQHLGLVMKERVKAALGAGQRQQLLELRAVQTRLFVRAVRAYDFNGPPPSELAALGGDFSLRAKQNGWLGPGGCLANDDELAVMFSLRWSQLTRLQSEPLFRPTLSELRRYYRFLLLHPERGSSFDRPASARARMRLRYVEALARHDTEYPLLLARGALLGELGQTAESAAELSAYLAQPAGQAWRLRARNYLLHAARAGGRAELSALPAP